MKAVVFDKGAWCVYVGGDPKMKSGTFVGRFQTKAEAEAHLPHAEGGIPLNAAYRDWLEAHPTLGGSQ